MSRMGSGRRRGWGGEGGCWVELGGAEISEEELEVGRTKGWNRRGDKHSGGGGLTLLTVPKKENFSIRM